MNKAPWPPSTCFVFLVAYFPILSFLDAEKRRELSAATYKAPSVSPRPWPEQVKEMNSLIFQVLLCQTTPHSAYPSQLR